MARKRRIGREREGEGEGEGEIGIHSERESRREREEEECKEGVTVFRGGDFCPTGPFATITCADCELIVSTAKSKFRDKGAAEKREKREKRENEKKKHLFFLLFFIFFGA